jgi:Uma2 family endonuclease
LTVADLDRLPADGNRYELIDGVVRVSPSPTMRHQRVAKRLDFIIECSAPPDAVVVQGVGVVVSDDQCPIPDLVVLRAPADDTKNRFPTEQVLLAVEVVSPSTRSADRLTKPAMYAAAGIPNYWRVELDPLHVVVYKLDDDGTYAEWARGEADIPLKVPVPFPIDLDPSDLLR